MTIHDSQEVEWTQVFTDRWNDWHNVAQTYSGILFNLKKGNPVTCYKVDEPWRHYAKWNKASL